MKATLPEGYAEMSAEDKLKFFENYDFNDNSDELKKATSELARYKDAITKANAEAKKYKDERNALLSEEQKKAQASTEALEAMKAELEGLRKEKMISDYRGQFVGLGYSAELADETAQAIASGDFSKMFQNHKSFLEEQIKQAEAKALQMQPDLTKGKPPTPEDIKNAELAKMMKAAGI